MNIEDLEKFINEEQKKLDKHINNFVRRVTNKTIQFNIDQQNKLRRAEGERTK